MFLELNPDENELIPTATSERQMIKSHPINLVNKLLPGFVR